MKKVVFLCLFTVCALTVQAITARLSVSPARPTAGEVFMLNIVVDSMEEFSLKLPKLDGVKISRSFSSHSVNQNIINGRRTVNVTYQLQALAEKPGKIVIKPFTLDFDGKTISTNSLTLVVRDPASLPPQQRLGAQLLITPERKLYVGETVHVDLEIFVPYQWRLRGVSALELADMADAVSINNGNREGPFRQSSQPVRGSSGYTLELTGLFQLQKSGEFTPECRLTLQLNKSSENDFFFSPPPQNRTIIAKSSAKLTVLPLPPVPAGAVNTGLIGKWQVSGKLNKNQLRTGDIAEITLNFSGELPALGLQAPALTIPDARIYPPEVTQNAEKDSFTVKYPFVVLKPGNYQISLPLAIFDPIKGEYEISKIDLNYQVSLNPDAASLPPVSANVSGGNGSTEPADLIPFPIRPASTPVKLPLIRNIGKWIVLPAVMLLALIAAVLLPKRKADKESVIRRKELKDLIRRIKSSGNAGDILQESGASVIAESLGLSSGSTFSDIAQAVEKDDKLLMQFFQQLEAGKFAPVSDPIPENDLLREKVIRFLKKLLTVMVIFTALWANGGTFEEASEKFNQGNYAESARLFSKSQEGPAIDPAAAYNAGCAEYMQGNYAKALLYFTRSSLLDPWDHESAKAVEVTSGKLSAVPEKPHFMLRMLGFFRPDHYIFMAMILGVLSLWAIYLRKKISGGWIIAGVLMILTVMTIAAAVILDSTLYDHDRAIVTGERAGLRSIPAESGGIVTELTPGTKVFIREKKGGYFRVENSDLSGWIAQKDVERFLPDRVW